jgi:hypothetical protein
MLNRFARLTVLAGMIALASPLLATVCVPGSPPSQKAPPDPPPPVCEPKECDKCTKSPCYIATGT